MSRDEWQKAQAEDRRIAAEQAAESATDPDWVLQTTGENATQFLKRIDQTGQQLHAFLEKKNWEARMEEAFGEPNDAMKNELQRMFENLGTDVPDPDTERSIDHPYLKKNFIRVKGIRGGIPNYGINAEKLYGDANIINTALQTPGLTDEQRSVLTEMGQALDTYAQNDWERMAMETFRNNRRNNSTDDAIKQMGKVGLLIAAAAGVFIVGVPSIMKGKFPTAALFLAGFVALLASPDLYKSIFGGKHHAALKQLQESVRSQAFENESKTYNIEGSDWSSVAKDVTTPNLETTTLIDAMKNGSATNDMKIAYASRMVPDAANPTRKDLERMLDNPKDFIQFVEMMQKNTDPDARKAAAYYIAQDKTILKRKTQQTMQDLQKPETTMTA